MKIHVDIDVTPEEARTFLGLPDLEPVQQRMIAELEGRMMAYLAAMEPEAMVKTWLPMGLQGFEKFQDMVWGAMRNATRSSKGEDK